MNPNRFRSVDATAQPAVIVTPAAPEPLPPVKTSKKQKPFFVAVFADGTEQRYDNMRSLRQVKLAVYYASIKLTRTTKLRWIEKRWPDSWIHKRYTFRG